MTLRGRGPWLVSAGLHLVVGTVVLVLLVPEPRTPEVLRMRLVSVAGTPAPGPRTTWVPPASQSQAGAREPTLPGWRNGSAAAGPDPAAAPAPVSLNDLLGTETTASSGEEAAVPSAETGWSGPGGLGYSPPPLPPPGLAPPQGARWLLKLSIPGGGGFARGFEGLDSGHAELDRWLEEYLRTVSFPSSPDGQDYVVRWSLRLETGRPR